MKAMVEDKEEIYEIGFTGKTIKVKWNVKD